MSIDRGTVLYSCLFSWGFFSTLEIFIRVAGFTVDSSPSQHWVTLGHSHSHLRSMWSARLPNPASFLGGLKETRELGENTHSNSGGSYRRWKQSTGSLPHLEPEHRPPLHHMAQISLVFFYSNLTT